MTNVGKAAVILNAEQASAVSAERKQTIWTICKCVNDLVLARPEFTWGLAFRQDKNLGPLRHGGTRIGRLKRSRLNHRDRNRSHSLHRQRRQWLVTLVP